MPGVCEKCGRVFTEIQRCTTCKTVEYCGKACQTADWKKHKKVCISPHGRLARITELVYTEMTDAHGRWDSARVISLGRAAEADLLIIEFDLKKAVEKKLLEMMARAFTRTAQYPKALDYFERLLNLFDVTNETPEHTRTLMQIADLHIVLKHADEAKVLYKQVYAAGERDGNFEFHSKACLGLCKVEKALGNTDDAMTLANEALVAAGLLLDGEYSKSRDAAQAIIAIVGLSDLTSGQFDDSLLTRLDQLTAAVDATEEGGSSLCVKSAHLQCRRAFAMSRWVECAEACAKTMMLAAQPRFQQNPDVQAVGHAASETLETLHGFGFVAIPGAQ